MGKWKSHQGHLVLHFLQSTHKSFIRQYLSSLFSALLAVDRNGTAWRRLLGSGGYRSVKVVQKKALGKGLAVSSPGAVMTETGAVTVGTLPLNPPEQIAVPTDSSLPHQASVST